MNETELVDLAKTAFRHFKEDRSADNSRQITNEIFRCLQGIALIISQHDDGRGVRGDKTIGSLWADVKALQEISALLSKKTEHA